MNALASPSARTARVVLVDDNEDDPHVRALSRASRTTARAASASGPLLLAAGLASAPLPGQAAHWWQVIAGVMGVAVVLWIPAAWWGSDRLRRDIARGIVVLVPLATLTQRSGLPVDVQNLPWPWVLEPLSIGAAALTLPLPLAYGYALASALSVPAQVVLTGAQPDATWWGPMALHLANIVFVPFMDSMRTQLARQFRSEETERSGLDARARALAWQRERAVVDGILHDEVLATLLAGASGQAAIAGPLATQARTTTDLLDRWGRDAGTGEGRRDTAPLVDQLREITARAGADFTSSTTEPARRVPADVAQQITAAMRQALRNCSLHAPGAAVAVVVESSADGVRVTVADTGPGFDPHSVPPQRLGIRTGIVTRMELLPGGSARIDSAPGAGTRVRLVWRPGDEDEERA